MTSSSTSEDPSEIDLTNAAAPPDASPLIRRTRSVGKFQRRPEAAGTGSKDGVVVARGVLAMRAKQGKSQTSASD